jgi:hypothetical protein
MSVIYNTGVYSLLIQVLTGLVDLYVLTLDFEGEILFVKNLLWIEFFVQIIELSFYVWLVFSFSKIANITQYRYYDWVITTPSMLFTYSMFLLYHSGKHGEFYETVRENLLTFTAIALLNTAMLFFGFLTEIGRIPYREGTALGFVPFIMMFYLIYENYAKTTFLGQITFWAFSGIWALYGFAALMPYKLKNAWYNILDLFAKNFFGIFLAVYLWMNRKNSAK